MTSGVMESGKHRISFKVMQGEEDDLEIMVGVVRDGATWNEDHGVEGSTGGWFMYTQDGYLYGNRKQKSDPAAVVPSYHVYYRG